jgi:uncharacterized protein (UPF0335 family)
VQRDTTTVDEGQLRRLDTRIRDLELERSRLEAERRDLEWERQRL